MYIVYHIMCKSYQDHNLYSCRYRNLYQNIINKYRQKQCNQRLDTNSCFDITCNYNSDRINSNNLYITYQIYILHMVKKKLFCWYQCKKTLANKKCIPMSFNQYLRNLKQMDFGFIKHNFHMEKLSMCYLDLNIHSCFDIKYSCYLHCINNNQ